MKKIKIGIYGSEGRMGKDIISRATKFKEIDYVLYAGSLGRYYRKNINNFHNKSFIKIDDINFKNMKDKLLIYQN